jgi:hypothetical protein
MPNQLLATARVEQLYGDLARAAAIHPDVAARQLAMVKDLVFRVNISRNLGDPEYKAYLRACVETQDGNLITLF